MIAFLHSIFSLANAPYSIALLVVAFYVLLQIIGLMPWGEHDSNIDLHSESGGTGIDSAIPDHSHDFDHSGHEIHSDHEVMGHEGGLANALLGALGVGLVPLAVAWQTFFTMFGLTGIAATTVLASLTGKSGAIYLAFTLPLALVVGGLLSAFIIRGIAKLIPATSGEACRRRDLVGCLGVVISSRVTDEFGEVRLKDPQGRTLRVICRTGPTEPPLPEGTEVAVVDYESEKGLLYVSALTKLFEGKIQ